jgi:ribulose 1,5-bisphosphate carboxylase large subunit-like protein
LQSYGPDTIFLVGGSLYQHPEGKEAAAREFQQILEQ